ncbi:MAG: 4-hydroxy-3-methylbut-2-en-yl diphosphate reductase [Patescibacteria group bacterium]|nr:4-hydroxy-3-methylbut-2-en-yl diphosphate reductase [Patescibacteria group bacterium]
MRTEILNLYPRLPVLERPETGEKPLSVEKAVVAGNIAGCAGVNMANKLVLEMLSVTQGREPIYVNHPLTHNDISMQYFIDQGVIVFHNDFSQVPDGASTVFSAHGVTPDHYRIAEEKGLLVFDATCPLVKTQQDKAQRIANSGGTVLLIGAKNHPETESIRGFAEEARPGSVHVIFEESDVHTIPDVKGEHIEIVTQTTLGIYDTRDRIHTIREARPDIEVVARRGNDEEEGDLCYATTNRQESVEKLVLEEGVDSILVVGSQKSHNSKMLAHLGEQLGVPARLINTGGDIQREWFDGVRRVGISGGASAEISLIRHVTDWFTLRGVPIEYQDPVRVEKDGATFAYPEITKRSFDLLRNKYSSEGLTI